MITEAHELPDLPLVLNATEAAKLLDVSIKTLYELAITREIPCRKIGREYRFHRDAVLEWLRAKERVARKKR